MAIPTTNVSLLDIQAEFGGVNPISISEYHRNAASGYVTDKNYFAPNAPGGDGTTVNGLLPIAGGTPPVNEISIGMFRGAQKVMTPIEALNLFDTGVRMFARDTNNVQDWTPQGKYNSSTNFNFGAGGSIADLTFTWTIASPIVTSNYFTIIPFMYGYDDFADSPSGALKTFSGSTITRSGVPTPLYTLTPVAAYPGAVAPNIVRGSILNMYGAGFDIYHVSTVSVGFGLNQLGSLVTDVTNGRDDVRLAHAFVIPGKWYYKSFLRNSGASISNSIIPVPYVSPNRDNIICDVRTVVLESGEICVTAAAERIYGQNSASFVYDTIRYSPNGLVTRIVERRSASVNGEQAHFHILANKTASALTVSIFLPRTARVIANEFDQFGDLVYSAGQTLNVSFYGDSYVFAPYTNFEVAGTT